MCQGWCDKTLVTLCASLVGVSRRHALMVVLSHHSAPDSLVKQVFANFVWKMSALVISQRIATPFQIIYTLPICIPRLSWICNTPCKMRLDSAFESRECVIAHSYYPVSRQRSVRRTQICLVLSSQLLSRR